MSIETAPGNIAIAGRTRKYWYSVPYPSSIHWHAGIQTLPWLAGQSANTDTNSNSNSNSNMPSRNILAIFIGSLKVLLYIYATIPSK
jgi:hypothetical protein